MTAAKPTAAPGTATHAAAALDARLLAYMARGMGSATGVMAKTTATTSQAGDDFNRLALDLFAYQYAWNPVVRSVCADQGLTPDDVRRWQDIPPVPVAAFKAADVVTFPVEQAVACFETSGTTGGTQRRGRHYFPTLALYDAALLAPFRHFLLPDRPALRILALAPAPTAAPNSSLSYYLGVIVGRLGLPGSRFYWQGTREAGRLDIGGLVADLTAVAAAAEPVLLVGTAFAFVHFLDHCRQAGLSWQLPAGSRAMETGGFKGQSRELPQPALYRELAGTFGLPVAAIVNQYGMTELSSQFYEPALRQLLSGGAVAPGDADSPRPKLGPPWARALIRDPETLQPLPAGRVGLIEILDLANRGSASALLTQDLGRLTAAGLTVYGRAPTAAPRGCSIGADAALGSGQGPAVGGVGPAAGDDGGWGRTGGDGHGA